MYRLLIRIATCCVSPYPDKGRLWLLHIACFVQDVAFAVTARHGSSKAPTPTGLCKALPSPPPDRVGQKTRS